jgi:hypothetical protein
VFPSVPWLAAQEATPTFQPSSKMELVGGHTKQTRYLDASVYAADVCLSYLYVQDVGLPPGRLADHGLKTRGWTGVSVQNQHLHGVVETCQNSAKIFDSPVLHGVCEQQSSFAFFDRWRQVSD